MSDTPMTDKNEDEGPMSGAVSADFARSLERHANAMAEALNVALATTGSLAPDYPPEKYVRDNEAILRSALTTWRAFEEEHK